MLDHLQHDCIQLEDAAESFQTQAQEDLKLLNSKSEEFRNAICEADDLDKVSTDHADALGTQIQKRASTLHELATNEENRLTKDVEKALEQNKKQLDHFKEGLNITKSSIDSIVEFTERLVDYGNPAEIASMKSQTLNRLCELSHIQHDKPPVLQKLIFQTGEQPIECLKAAFGVLSPDNKPDISTTYEESDGESIEEYPQWRAFKPFVKPNTCHTYSGMSVFF